MYFFFLLLLLLCFDSSTALFDEEEEDHHPQQQHPFRFRQRHRRLRYTQELLSLSEECQTAWYELHARGTLLGDAHTRQSLQYTNITRIDSFESQRPLNEDRRCGVVVQGQQDGVFHVHCDLLVSSLSNPEDIIDGSIKYRDACISTAAASSSSSSSTSSSSNNRSSSSVDVSLYEEEEYNITCYMSPTSWEYYEENINASSFSIFSITLPGYYGCYPSSPTLCTLDEISNDMYYTMKNITLSYYEGQYMTWQDQDYEYGDEYYGDEYYIHSCAIGNTPISDIYDTTYIPPYDFDFDYNFTYNTNNNNPPYYWDQQNQQGNDGGLGPGFIALIMIFVFIMFAAFVHSRQQQQEQQARQQQQQQRGVIPHHYITTTSNNTTTIASIAVAPNTTTTDATTATATSVVPDNTTDYSSSDKNKTILKKFIQTKQVEMVRAHYFFFCTFLLLILFFFSHVLNLHKISLRRL